MNATKTQNTKSSKPIQGVLSGSASSRSSAEVLPLRAFKTELNPNNKQARILMQYCHASDWVFNLGLRSRMYEYKNGAKSSSAYSQQVQLTALKKETRFKLLNGVPVKVFEYAFADVEDAYNHFFRRCKTGEKPGFPRFKSAKRPHKSFRVRSSIKIEERRIRLPIIGWLRLKERNYIPGGNKTCYATVSFQAGRWFVSVTQKTADVLQSKGSEIIGIDVGLKSFITTSDGKFIQAPKPLQKSLKKLARLQRHFARQKKGGANWKKTKLQISRLHKEIGDIRANFIHNTTSWLVKTYGGFVIEDLNIAGMIKNKHLARHIADVGWSEFARQLEYKCKDAGIELIKADKWFPSTKRCSRCGHKKDEIKLSERTYRCDECGLILDRDINAARNLAQYLLVCSEEVTPVESHSKPRKRGTKKQEVGVAVSV